MINYDEKMVLNSRLVIKMGIDQIGKNFVKSMSVKKFSYLGQFIQGLRTPDDDYYNLLNLRKSRQTNECQKIQLLRTIHMGFENP